MADYNAMIEVHNSDGLTLNMDGARLHTESSKIGITDLSDCKNTKITARGVEVVGCRGGEGADLVVTNIDGCQNTEINHDNSVLRGNMRNATIAKVNDSSDTSISLRNVRVEADNQYSRATSDGTLVTNMVTKSSRTKIDETGMTVSGAFREVRNNQISGSRGTEILQSGMTIDVRSPDEPGDEPNQNDSDGEEGEIVEHISEPPTSDNYQNTKSKDEQTKVNDGNGKCDTKSAESSSQTESTVIGSEVKKQPATSSNKENMHPQPTTYKSNSSEKLSFLINFPRGGSITFNLAGEEPLKTVTGIINRVYPPARNKHFRLKKEKDGTYIDSIDQESITLEKLGIKNEMEMLMIED